MVNYKKYLKLGWCPADTRRGLLSPRINENLELNEKWKAVSENYSFLYRFSGIAITSQVQQKMFQKQTCFTD